jgi:hypothetical protein
MFNLLIIVSCLTADVADETWRSSDIHGAIGAKLGGTRQVFRRKPISVPCNAKQVQLKYHVCALCLIQQWLIKRESN